MADWIMTQKGKESWKTKDPRRLNGDGTDHDLIWHMEAETHTHFLTLSKAQA